MDLIGSSCRLQPTTADDRDALLAIRSAPEVRLWWRGDDLVEEFEDSLANTDLHLLSIWATPDGESHERIVGLIQYEEEHDPDYRHAGIDIYIDPAAHRQGFALDSLATLIDHLCTERGHHRITIDPAADNAAAIACYAKVGFEPVGVMRSYERREDGSWSDSLLMELVRFGS